MNEFELIERLTAGFPSDATVIAGVGEDCAVLDAGLPDEYLLFKTDAVVEDVHFTAETPPQAIGRKALARCLSDIAAMAGRPGHALITLGLPRNSCPERLEQIYAGLKEIAAKHATLLVGGETTRNGQGLFISIALTGYIKKTQLYLRSNAKVGDAIFVTGELGGSLAGKHLSFEPRLAEARWLADHFPMHALIDLSDGLAGDLRHILKQSRLGAELHSNAIPISREAKIQAQGKASGKTPLLAALTDGEDFELLFTLPSRHAVPLLDAWKARFPSLKLSVIGKMTREPGLRIRDKQGVRQLEAHGYTHFQ